MDIGSSILHHVERHLNACLTCYVMRHGTHGYDVTIKRSLGVAGFSPEVLDTLFTRMKKHQALLLSGNTCSEVDTTMHNLSTEDFSDMTSLPQWLLLVVTEKELSLQQNVTSLCRWYRRIKAWHCDCLTVVTATTTPPHEAPPLPLSVRVHDLCMYNPEIDDMKTRGRLKTFYISHWDPLENTEGVFVDMVQKWLAGKSPSIENPPPLPDDDHMPYSNIAKMLIRDINESLPQIQIFIRLSLMVIMGLISVILTLAIILFISKDGGIEQDIRRAQEYIVSHIQTRRSPRSEWGRSHTPTVLTTLQLHNQHWCFDTTHNQRSVDQLEIGILASLSKLSPKTRNKSTYTPQRLSYDILALLATFQNPRDFHDHDLVAILKRYVSDVIPYATYSAHAYSSYIIALYNNGESLDGKHADRIISKQNKDGSFNLGINEAAVSLMALSCVAVTDDHVTAVQDIVRFIRHQRRNDGSYGSLYTTALVLQAYNISGMPVDTMMRKEATLSYLVTRCYGNRVLRDPDVASAVLLALSGRSLLDISHIIGVDHKKHAATAALSSGQHDKYRYLTPDVTTVHAPTDANLKEVQQKSQYFYGDSKTQAEQNTTVNGGGEVKNETLVNQKDLNNASTYLNGLESTNQNQEPSEADDTDDSAADNEPKGQGHRWKLWKQQYESNKSLNGHLLSNVTRRDKNHRRSTRPGFTMNEGTVGYIFLKLCTV